jgi:uncharacterized 2Fe-2S/4Fe-4S cluster protein (DUF4445 family)
MVDIRIDDRTVAAEKGQSILEALIAGGVLLRSDCGGKGRCAKCRVRIIEADPGAVSAIDESEAAVLDQNARAAGIRLACRAELAGSVTIEIPEDSRLSPEVARKGPPLLFQRLKQNQTAISQSPGHRWGLAVDLGTTTIAVYLCDRLTATVTASMSVRNPQAVFGDDVMSRIGAARSDAGSLSRMQRLVIKSLDWAAENICNAAQLKPNAVQELVVVGNTTMIHLLLGEDPSSIGIYPYRPNFVEGRRLSAKTLGLTFNPGAKVITMPLITGFIGSDIVAAALAAELDTRKTGTLLVDVGTNGEIMAAAPDGLAATSCATGPAFEGAAIRHGMQALSGAIDAVRIEPRSGRVDCRLIQHRPYQPKRPAGICGSGVISVVAAMLRAGWLQSSGAFDRNTIPKRLLTEDNGEAALLLVPAEEAESGRPITLTQKDVRAVQLAKGALRAGIDLLDRKLGIIRPHHLLLAGAFGSTIDIADALTIGMFPPLPEQSVAVIGNAAGAGAILAVFERPIVQKAQEICIRTEVMELADQPDFQDTFVKSLSFPETHSA